MALTRVSTGGIQDDAVTDAKLPANSVGNSEMKDDAVGIAELSATGTASSSTFLRGDNTWVTPTDTNTQLTTEEVQDIVGAMFTGNTETNIAATYQDADGTIDLVSTDTDTQVGGATGVDFNDDVKVRFGTGNDVEIYHSGSHSFIKNSTGNLYLEGTSGSNDIVLWSQDDIRLSPQNGQPGVNVIGAGAVELYYNGYKKLETSTNGTTLTGNLFISDSADTDSGRIKLGAGEDLQIYHEGSNSYLNDTGTGFLSVQGSEVHIRGSNNENGIKVITNDRVELYYDNAKKLETVTGGVTVTGTCTATAFAGDGSSLTGISTSGGATGIDFNDDVKARFGTGNDLELYHDGSNSNIKNATGWLNVSAGGNGFSVGNGDFSENLFKATNNGAVELYYDGVKYLETRSDGTKTYGDHFFNGTNNYLQWDKSEDFLRFMDGVDATFGNGDDLRIYHDGSHSYIKDAGTGNLVIQTNLLAIQSANGLEDVAKFTEDGAVELYYDNAVRFQTTAGGVLASGALESTGLIYSNNNDIKTGGDTGKLMVGAGNDLQIYHDGSHSYIAHTNNTNDLRIRAAYNKFQGANGDNMLVATQDAGVILYYDNSQKCETTSTGVDITGHVKLGDSSRVYFGDGDDMWIGWNGSDGEVSLASGALYMYDDTIFYDDKKAKFGTGADLEIYHSGSNSFIKHVGTGDLYLQCDNGEDIYLRPKANEDGVKVISDGGVELYYDNVKKLNTHADGVEILGKLYMADSKNIELGSSQDLKIYHDGSNSYIDDLAGTGSLKIRTNQLLLKNHDGDENYLIANSNGQVDLYYDNVKKLETYSGGIRTFDHISCGGSVVVADNNKFMAGDGDDLQIFHDGAHSDIKNGQGNLHIRNDGETNIQNNGGTENRIKTINNGAVELYYDNAKKFETNAYGTITSGHSYLFDSHKVQLGSSQDFQIYHDGNHNYIDSSNGNVYIRSAGGENMGIFEADGAVNLYFNNVKRLETVSYGIKVIGHYYADDDYDIRLGTDSDMKLYHDGTDSYIENATGKLYLKTTNFIDIRGNGNETMIKGIVDGAVELYHDNVKRFQTQSNGVGLFGLADSAGNSDLRYNSTNGTVSYDSSTRLVKKNIIDCSYGLDIVNQLKPRKYIRKDDANTEEIGFIADEVVSLIPEIVPIGPKSLVTKNEADTEEIPLNVDYRKMCVVLTKAIQELTTEVSTLKEKVAALESS